MRLVYMQDYMLSLPGEDPERVTYAGHFPGDDWICDVCFREGNGGHEFLVGEVDNPSFSYHIGTNCLRKCKITPVSSEITSER